MLEKNKELMQKNPFAWENYEYDMDSNVYYDQNHQSYSEDHIKKMQDAYERQQYEEQNKNKIQNPYAQENFEYNMDDDLYYSEKGDVYTPDQLEKLQKEYEESLQKQEENKNDELYGDNLDITIHETRSEEEMARLYANENQLKLKESIDEEITEVNIKQDSVQAPEGDPIPEPQYIGWDRAFTVRQKDDSEKMADIRACSSYLASSMYGRTPPRCPVIISCQIFAASSFFPARRKFPASATDA